MATRTVAGSNTPAHPAPEGQSDVRKAAPESVAPAAPEPTYLFRPQSLHDMTGVDIPADGYQQIIDRTYGVARGASILVEMLMQDTAEAEAFDDPTRFFNGNHHGAIADLVKHSLDMLADEIDCFATSAQRRRGAQ